MRRLLTLFAVMLTLLTGSLGTVAAQDSGTPPAGNDGSGSLFYSADGQEEGVVSVAQVVDPFEDYDTGYAPQRGFHFVMAVVTITSVSDRTIEPNSSGFYLIDTDGFLYYPTYLSRPSADMEALPDLPSDTLEPEKSLTGAIFFEVLDNTSPGLITYQPSYDRLATAADLRDEPVAPGDDVEFLASNGQPAAIMTVGDVTLPLKDFSSPPQRGSEFAGVEITVENTGDDVLDLQPYAFSYVDAEGFVYSTSFTSRTEAGEAKTPTLESTELAAGDSVTGLLTFEVFAGSDPGMIYYSPSSDRQVRIAEFGDAAGGVTGEDVVIATPAEDVTPESTVASSPECDDVLVWAKASQANIVAWSEALSLIGPALTGQEIDFGVARDVADQMTEIANDQADLDVPELAQEGSELVIALFEDSVVAMNSLADALESGSATEISAAGEDIAALGSEEYLAPLGEAITDLTTTCPALDSLG